jgi:acetyltransferase-like isoleucine patch superfamily enzyme
MIKRKFTSYWERCWMRYAGPDLTGRMATRMAVLFAPPYQFREYLRYFNPQGYISPKATICHSKLRLGANVFIGDRVMILEQKGGGTINLGDRVSLWGESQLEVGQGGEITMGERTRVNRGVQVVSYLAPIHIGRDVGLSTNCLLYSFNHGIAAGRPYLEQPLESNGPIVIDDHAWIGMGSIILSGVHIGEHAVVAAGSVVHRDVPAGAIAAGNPARVGKTRQAEIDVTEATLLSAAGVSNESRSVTDK